MLSWPLPSRAAIFSLNLRHLPPNSSFHRLPVASRRCSHAGICSSPLTSRQTPSYAAPGVSRRHLDYALSASHPASSNCVQMASALFTDLAAATPTGTASGAGATASGSRGATASSAVTRTGGSASPSATGTDGHGNGVAAMPISGFATAAGVLAAVALLSLSLRFLHAHVAPIRKVRDQGHPQRPLLIDIYAPRTNNVFAAQHDHPAPRARFYSTLQPYHIQIHARTNSPLSVIHPSTDTTPRMLAAVQAMDNARSSQTSTPVRTRSSHRGYHNFNRYPSSCLYPTEYDS